MKIQSMKSPFGYPLQVREKNEGESPRQETLDQQHQEQSSSDSQEPEVSTDQVNEAIESFQTDTLALAHGLSASVEGQGPGLRVILKDGTGNIVRQFKGREFLRLKEAASKDKGSRGKILDRKT